jgi:hypothetical protein
MCRLCLGLQTHISILVLLSGVQFIDNKGNGQGALEKQYFETNMKQICR